jgi:hypothetical protein
MSTRSKNEKKTSGSGLSPDNEAFIEEMKTLIEEEIMNAFATHVKEALQNELSKIVAPINDLIVLLKSKNAKLRVEVDRLSIKCNANEQYSRKYNLRIGGITEEHSEDCYQAVSNFFQNEIGISINDAEIDRAHRVGRPGGFNPRQMIVKFKGYRAKQEVLKNRRNLKGKKGLYVREDLTAYNLELVRCARDTEYVSSCWSNDGKIFVKLNNCSIHVVCSKDDLLNIKPVD